MFSLAILPGCFLLVKCTFSHQSHSCTFVHMYHILAKNLAQGI